MKNKIFLTCLLMMMVCAMRAQVVTTGNQTASETDESAFKFTESQLGEDDDAIQSVSALVSPGTAIMSSPTEQTQVIASSLSTVRTPDCAAAIMP